MHDYTFLVGAPGSRWSGVGQQITKAFNYNCSDETEDRVYTHGKFSGHKGAYWGPGMELGHKFHQASTLQVDDFLSQCNVPFSEQNNKTKMIKCHQFAHSLDWLYENIPNSNILLVLRPNKECFDWWKQAGGWDITYPDYSWYCDDSTMKAQIQIENTLSDEFVEKHSDWKPYTTEWITKNFGKHSIELDSRHNDIKVCLIDTKE